MAENTHFPAVRQQHIYLLVWVSEMQPAVTSSSSSSLTPSTDLTCHSRSHLAHILMLRKLRCSILSCFHPQRGKAFRLDSAGKLLELGEKRRQGEAEEEVGKQVVSPTHSLYVINAAPCVISWACISSLNFFLFELAEAKLLESDKQTKLLALLSLHVSPKRQSSTLTTVVSLFIHEVCSGENSGRTHHS